MQITTLPVPLDTLTSVRLHERRDRTDSPETLTPVYASGQWHIDTGAREGRYYPVLVGAVAGTVYSVSIDYWDLPHDPTLVVTPEALADEAGIALPISEKIRDAALRAIRNAQSDVVAYLGRAVTPMTFVQQSVWPYGEDWTPSLTAHGDEDVLRIVRVVAETYGGSPTGYFTVHYLAGLDGALDPSLDPIRRFVLAHAMNSPGFTEAWRVATGSKGEVKTITAEGQSISLQKASLGGGGGKPGDGAPGSLPTIGTLSRWRVAGRRVHQAPTQARPWPYDPMSAP